MNANKSMVVMLWVALTLLAACVGQKAYEKPPVPVGVSPVQTYTGEQGVRYSANVGPYTRVDLAFKVGGYVERILEQHGPDGVLRDVQEGDIVSRGTVLAQVRQSDYQEKLTEAKSRLAEAEALLQKATQDLDRAKRLFATQSITKPEFEAAQAQFDAARAKEQGGHALVEEAQIALRDTSLRAPMQGVVLKRLIEVGSLVGVGSPGFSIADMSSAKVVYGVPDTLVRKTKLGSPMTITTEAVPGREFHGRITAIAPNADARSRLFDVEITVPNPERLLKAGMIASLQVPDGPAPISPQVVPISAIVRSKTDPTGYALFVVEQRGDQQVARVREVKLGETYGNLIAITSGTTVDETVIVTGATLIVDGQRVRVIP
jgi:RND family efflux transporter MFP subunit